MPIILVIASFITIALLMAFVNMYGRRPEPAAASMLKRTDDKGDNR